MVYNGLWSDNTCSKLISSSTQLASTSYYNRGTPNTSTNSYGTVGFITYVGYNYNNTYGYNNTGNTSAIANSTLFNNSTASYLRTQIENWYTNVIGTSNNSLFESNAGYCNDRSTYINVSPGASPTTSTAPYKVSGANVIFGANFRISINDITPSLACPNLSGFDLLNNDIGKSYPVALITADEAFLAGNGLSGKGAFSKSSFLTSGSGYWLLTPSRQASSGALLIYNIAATGAMDDMYPYFAYGVRPTVSLAPETIITGGSGTAADPWTVQ